MPRPLLTGSVSLEEFRRLDLRIGEISDAQPIEDANRLLRLEIDLGNERRTVVAGLARHYEPASLVGATVVVLANIEPVAIHGVRSEAMLLGAECDSAPVLLTTAGVVANGTRVS